MENFFGKRDTVANIQPVKSTILQKILKATSYFIWVSRAPFNFLNTYVGSQAILSIMGASTDNWGSYSLGIYAALTNQVGYHIYTFGSINKNCNRISNPYSNIDAQTNNEFLYKRFLIEAFLHTGTLSFSALSFFLTREALETISWTNDNFSPESISLISGFSAGTAFLSEIFSKNMDLHYMIAELNLKSYRELKQNKPAIFYSHTLMGAIFTFAMAISYYTGCLNLSEDIGLQNKLSESLWAAIFIYTLFSISGGALELAFSVKPMFDSIKTTAPLLEDHATTIALSPNSNCKSFTSANDEIKNNNENSNKNTDEKNNPPKNNINTSGSTTRTSQKYIDVTNSMPYSDQYSKLGLMKAKHSTNYMALDNSTINTIQNTTRYE